jgi:hypothetical protein
VTAQSDALLFDLDRGTRPKPENSSASQSLESKLRKRLPRSVWLEASS